MSYEVWNRLLFQHFFNEDQEDRPVILYVDEGLINAIGKELGDWRDFVISLVAPDDRPVQFLQRFNSLLSHDHHEMDSLGHEPPYFGALCLTILTWTVNPNLHGLNYYGRLQKILEEAYFSYFRSQGLSENDAREISERFSNIDQNRFRTILEEAFKKLEFHTIETLSGDLGFYDFLKVGGFDYVGIPKAQALLSAMDREGLERFFFETNDVHPGEILSKDKANNLLETRGLEYITQATRNRWNENISNKKVIIDIVCSLVKHWDGTYVEPDISAEGAYIGNKPRLAGVCLWPTLHSNTFGPMKLKARVEFLNQDFPIESPVKFKIQEVEYIANRQSGGWSSPLQDETWTLLLNEQEEIKGPHHIRFQSLSVYIFELNRELGGFIPAKEVGPGSPYKVLANVERGNAFLEANQEMLTEIDYEPPMEGWKLYDAKTGLVNFDLVYGINQRPANKIFELYGGARVGHGSRRTFSQLVPPRVSVLRPLPDGVRVVCKHGIETISSMELQNDELDSYKLPSSAIQSARFEVLLHNENGSALEGYDSIKFKLDPFSMPNEEYRQARLLARDDSIDEDVLPATEFLYNLNDFKLYFTGGVPLDKSNDDKNNFILSPKMQLPTIHINKPLLSGLSIVFGSFEIKPSSEDNSTYCLPSSISAGKHLISAKWHGNIISSAELSLIEPPKIFVKLVGAQPAKIGGKEVCFTLDREVPPRIKIITDHKEKPRINVFLDDVPKLSIPSKNSKGNELVCPKEGLAHLKLRWGGIILEDKHFLFRHLPDKDKILVQVSDEGAQKWKDSYFYNPLAPPSLDVVVDETFNINGLKIFLGNQSLIAKNNGTLFSLPPEHDLVGANLSFKATYYDVPLPFKIGTTIYLQHKPSCEIVSEGKELSSNTYLEGLLPNIKCIFGGVNQPWQTDNLKLKIDNDTLLTPQGRGYFDFSTNILRDGELERNVTIKAYWFGEVVGEKSIVVVSNGKKNIHFIGGHNLVRRGYIYPPDSLPEKVKVEQEHQWEGIFLLFGLRSGQKIKLRNDQSGEFLLDEGVMTSDAIRSYPSVHNEYVIELWKGEVKLCSKTFTTARPNWKKIGYNPGEIALVNSNVQWPAYWLIEKKSRLLRAYRYGNCPEENSSTSNLEQPKRNEIRDWKKIVRQQGIEVAPEEQQEWESFSSRNRG